MPADQLHRKLLEHQRIHFPQRQFFVSIAAAATLEAATRKAYDSIVAQLPSPSREALDILRDRCRVDRSSTDTDGMIHVLATLDREETSSYLMSRARTEGDAISEALKECATQLVAGEIPRARGCLTKLQQRLDRAHQIFFAARAVVGDQMTTSRLPVASEVDALAAKIGGVQLNRWSVMLHAVQLIDGQPAGELDVEFAPLLAAAELKRVPDKIPASSMEQALQGNLARALAQARASGAGYLVIIAVHARFSSEVEGQFFSMGRGVIQVVETAAGRVVRELSSPEIKGGHISREKASQQAIHKVVQHLKPQLVSTLKMLPTQ